MPDSFFFDAGARAKFVSDAGQNTVTVAPVPTSSFCNAVENESRKALHAL
jgi:hypothetical protein